MKIGNIVFDCADPRSLAIFWCDVLGYPKTKVEYPPDMRQDLLAAGLTEDDLASRAVAEDPTGDGPRLFFQLVPETKQVKNRVHLDISATPGRRPAPQEVDAEVARITAFGASVIGKVDHDWGPFHEYHYVLADPEGNEFCVQ